MTNPARRWGLLPLRMWCLNAPGPSAWGQPSTINPMNKDVTPSEPASNDLKTVWNLPPTTMIGTRPTVVLTYSLDKALQREREEEARVAKLGFWGRLLYKLNGGPRRYQ